eukprot:7537126-Karenia_brevis.AAC.1
MVVLASDQERAITSDQVGMACEKSNIKLDLCGLQGHTAAPLAERRLAIIKLTALKLWHTANETRLNTTQDT